jgi:hypothetical protein
MTIRITYSLNLSVPDRVIINGEDSIADSQPGPLRFACPVQVNYTLYNSAQCGDMIQNCICNEKHFYNFAENL